MIADFMPWIFPVAKQDEPLLDVNMRPLGLAYLFLTHCCRDRIANDAAPRDDLAGIALKILDEFVDVVLCGPPILLDASADKVEVAQRYSR